MLMRLRMLKLGVGKGRQIIKQLCCGVLQYYATERAGYVLYRALGSVFAFIQKELNAAVGAVRYRKSKQMNKRF